MTTRYSIGFRVYNPDGSLSAGGATSFRSTSTITALDHPEVTAHASKQTKKPGQTVKVTSGERWPHESTYNYPLIPPALTPLLPAATEEVAGMMDANEYRAAYPLTAE